MSRKNPKPPRAWTLPTRKGGTAPLGTSKTTVGAPKGKRPQRRDPIHDWVAQHLPTILNQAEVDLSEWTGKKLGEGSFGLVYELTEGRVLKLGFDYSESWFLHNLPTFMTTAEDDAADALPRIYHHSDLSHLPGWEQLLTHGSPVFQGVERDAAPFVMVREDVQSLVDAGTTGRAAVDGVVASMLERAAGRTRGSMERYEKAMTSSGAVSIPKLEDGLDFLRDFMEDVRESGLSWPSKETLEQAQEALGPIVSLLENLSEHWEVYLPDARDANAGRTADGRVVLRDMGWVYAPQYTEWTVTDSKSMVDLWD